MKTIEVRASELRLGDVIVSKANKRRQYKVTGLMPGLGGHQTPYLTLSGTDGEQEHDTSLDSLYATYTVIRDCQ